MPPPRKTARPTSPLSEGSYPKSAGSTPDDKKGDSRAGSPPRKHPQLRYDRPFGAKMIARAVVMCAMDYDAAIRLITKDWDGLSEAQIADYAEKCEASPLVKQYVEEEL